MKIKGRRILRLLLTLVILAGLLPTVALAAGGSVTMAAGEKRTIYSDKRTGTSDNWSSTDQKVVTVKEAWNDKSAVLSGVGAGTATVEHTWYTATSTWPFWEEHTETWEVTVTEPAKPVQTVYVYLHIVDDNGKNLRSYEGMDVNSEGWFTVGTIQMELEAADHQCPYAGNNHLSAHSEAIGTALEDIVPYEKNAGLNIPQLTESIRWEALKCNQRNASDYADAPATAWHLDGSINVAALESLRVTITYTDGVDGEEVFENQVYRPVSGTAMPEFRGTPARGGYVFTGWDPVVPGLVPDQEATYTAQWAKERVTVRYVAGQGGTVTQEREDLAYQSGGYPAQGSAAVAGEGYTFDGWYDAEGKQVGGGHHFVPASVSGDTTYYARFSREGAPVYVYAQIVDGKGATLTREQLIKLNAQLETPLTMNHDDGGWLTLGKIENFPGLETAGWGSPTYHLSTDLVKAQEAAEAVKTMEPYKREDKVVNPIDTSKATWKELKVVDQGAANYDDVTGYAWHLDGQIKVTDLVDLKVEKTVTKIVRNGSVVYSKEDGSTESVPDAEPGDVITWNITVSNGGCLNALMEAPTDTLTIDPDAQDGTKPLAVVYEGEPAGEGQKYPVSAAGSINFTAGYTVVDGDRGKTLTNTAVIGADGPSDSNHEVKVADEAPPAEPDWKALKVGKTADSITAAPGGTVTYAITVKNDTGKTLQNIQVSDPLDNNLTFKSANPTEQYHSDTGIWTISSLEDGKEAVLTIQAEVQNGAADQTAIVNTATVVAAADEDDNKLPGGGHPSASVTVTVAVQARTYTLTYDANGGTGAPAAVSGLSAGTHTLDTATIPTHAAVNGKAVVFAGWKPYPDSTIYSTAPSGLVTEVLITTDTTVYAVWAVDQWRDPNNDQNGSEPGDGIPDYQQVLVVYQSSNTSYGTVNKASDVFTLAKDPSGQYTGSVTAEAVASTTSIGRTYFIRWTMGNAEISTAPGLHNTIQNAQGGRTYTITANFGRTSSSGGSSSGGSSSAGSGAKKPDVKLNTEDHDSYIIGYQDGCLRPYGTITRGEAATIFFRLLTDETRGQHWSQTNSYSDCGPALWCNNAISTLTRMGIIDGFQDGTFRPYAEITRAQFAKIAVGFFETTREEYAGSFTDVDISAWYAEYVEAAARVGLIQGFQDGTFRPDTNITRAQACVIVNRALGRKPDEDHLLKPSQMITWPDNNPGDWFYADMQEATNSHDYTWLAKGSDKQHMENWTKKLEQRDWAAFEHAWSTARSAPGGEAVR